MGEAALAGSIINGFLQATGIITNGVVKSKEMKYGAQVQVSENEQGGKSNRTIYIVVGSVLAVVIVAVTCVLIFGRKK
ncbi:MAG: hypothetical protein ACI3Z8_04690 [Paludibacteraceae bacterium]